MNKYFFYIKNIIFGKSIGENNGVTAYNNDKEDNDLFEGLYHIIELNNELFITGIKWECIEYVRRWLLINKNIIFDQVNNAVDLFYTFTAKKLDGNIIKTQSIENNFITFNNLYNYKKGDLLIWDTTRYPKTGHVAVITYIDRINGELYICEQNNESNSWLNSNYSRKLSVTDRINEDGILGIIKID